LTRYKTPSMGEIKCVCGSGMWKVKDWKHFTDDGYLVLNYRCPRCGAEAVIQCSFGGYHGRIFYEKGGRSEEANIVYSDIFGPILVFPPRRKKPK